MTKLEGKVALVTGGGRGIGPVIAERLADDGATVVVSYANSAAGADKVVQAIAAKGGRAIAIQTDIGKRAEVQKMFAQIDSDPGRLDIVVNCAGISGTTPLENFDLELIQRIFDVNMWGPLYIAAEAAKRLPSGGRIVNFSTSVAEFPIPGASGYIGAKNAVKGFTDVWAKELGAKGITVNTVIPGATSPGMIDNSPKYHDLFANASPFKRVGRAQEVAAVVAFLCSPEASWVSGTHILVNGAATK